MDADNTTLDKYAAAVDALEAEKHQDRDDMDDIDRAIASLRRIVRRRRPQVKTPEAHVKHDAARIDGMAAPIATGAFKGLSSAEAAVKILLDAGRQLKTKIIVNELERAGFDQSTASPGSTLSGALQRRADNFGDILKVCHGTWIHRDHLTTKIVAAMEHRERTQRGMAQRKARGLHIGAVSKITPERMDEIRAMRAEGKSVTAIARHFGYHPNTVRNNLHKHDEGNATEGGSADGDRPKLELVRR